MASLSRRLASMEPARLSAMALGVTLALGILAFAFSAVSVPPTAGALLAALALVAVAGSGLLYAWRLGPGTLGD